MYLSDVRRTQALVTTLPKVLPSCESKSVSVLIAIEIISGFEETEKDATLYEYVTNYC